MKTRVQHYLDDGSRVDIDNRNENIDIFATDRDGDSSFFVLTLDEARELAQSIDNAAFIAEGRQKAIIK